MPRELPIIPCAEQKLLLESLGFEFAPESWDYPVVTWSGCGVSLKIWKETDKPSLPEVMNAIVQCARAAGATEARRAMQKAIGMP